MIYPISLNVSWIVDDLFIIPIPQLLSNHTAVRICVEITGNYNLISASGNLLEIRFDFAYSHFFDL